jgi:VWFA-related protein
MPARRPALRKSRICSGDMSKLAATGVAAFALLVLCARPVSAQRPFVERVDVSRVLIDARVLDDEGHVLPGLGPEDFRVTIDGDPVRVESAEWIEGGEGDVHETVTDGGELAATPQPDGRLIVVLVQKDLEPKRVVGLMVMLRVIEALLQQLQPADRVAVLSFDSRLRMWTDFTSDINHVRSVLTEHVLLRFAPPNVVSEGPSLLARLDLTSTKRAGDFENSLRMIGEALEPFPGAKSVVLLGYGFGRFDPSTLGATMMPSYADARAALQQARASVFSLNVTQANYNSLQVGLQRVAAATGGFYVSTYEFPTLAMERVVHALRGYYVLFVDKPRAKPGEHRIDVRLVGRNGSVFARSGYVD